MFVGPVFGVGSLAVVSLAAVVLVFGRGRLSAAESQKHLLRAWAKSLGSSMPVAGFLSP